MMFIISLSEKVADVESWSKDRGVAAILLDVMSYYAILANGGSGDIGAVDTWRLGHGLTAKDCFVAADGHIVIVRLANGYYSKTYPTYADAVIHVHIGNCVWEWANNFTLRQIVNRREIRPTKMRLSPAGALSLGVVNSTTRQIVDCLKENNGGSAENAGGFTATVIDRGVNELTYTAIWPKGADRLSTQLIGEPA